MVIFYVCLWLTDIQFRKKRAQKLNRNGETQWIGNSEGGEWASERATRAQIEQVIRLLNPGFGMCCVPISPAFAHTHKHTDRLNGPFYLSFNHMSRDT